MTPVAGIVELRADMAHLSAWNDLIKKRPKKSKQDDEEVDWDKPRPKDEGGEFEDQDDDVSITESESKATVVNLMAKSTAKSKKRRNKAEHAEVIALLKAMREEPWERLEWIDQDVGVHVPTKNFVASTDFNRIPAPTRHSIATSVLTEGSIIFLSCILR